MATQDGDILHFLKEFPAWLILSILFLTVLFVHVHYQIPFLERIIDTVMGGLLATLIGTRKPTTTVNADSVNTPAVNAESMDNATIYNSSSDAEEKPPED